MRRLIRLARNILLLAIAVIVILAGILAFNTFTHGSRQLQVTAAPRAEIDAQAAARRLAEAIRFRTISSYEKPDQHAEALRGMRAHIEKSFPAFHAAAKREIVGRYSLLYTWAGSDPRAQPIAFLAHQDVVPVAPGTEKDWQQPPFDGVISDGFIWGRGSWDDKGNLYSMLEAAEAMAKAGFRPKRTIYFAFGHDEELSNLWLFRPLLLREFEKSGPTEAMVRTTTALTIFNAGDKDNVLPGKAEATVNFRLIPGDTQESVIDHVRSTIANDRISIKPFPGNTDPPPVTATASPSFQMLTRTIREIYPDVIVAPGLMVAATDSRHYTGITDKIFRFSPVRANSEDLKRFHGTNERLPVEGYADMIRFYRRLIENAAG